MRTLSFLILSLLMMAGCNVITVSDIKSSNIPKILSPIYLVESTHDGTGIEIGDFSIEMGNNRTLYAIKRDLQGGFLANIPVSWTKIGTSGNLLIGGAGESADFIPITPGQTQIAISINSKVVKTITATVIPAANPPLDVSNFVISGITSSGFTGTIDFAGGSPGQSHTLYYCNSTVSAGCNPVGGSSSVMSVSGSTYTTTISGLTNPGDTFNVRVISMDSVTVTGSPMNTTVTLDYNALTVSNLVISGVSSSSFTGAISVSGGSPAQTHTLYYCDAVVPACDPTAGTALTMTASGSIFAASVTGLSAGRTYNVSVVSTDITTVSGSPLNTTVSLLGTGITISSLAVTNKTKTGMTVTVNFSGDSENNSTVTLYYCNSTDTPSCNPTLGTSHVMTRSGSTYTATISGLTSPHDENDFLSLRVIAVDPNGVSGSPLSVSQGLYDLYLSSLTTSNVTYNGFTAQVNFTGDPTANGSAALYYCNETDNPGCDPLVGPGSTSLAMTRNASNYSINTLGMLSASDDLGDVLRIRVRGSDPDGTGHGSIGTMTSTLRLVDVSVNTAIVQISKTGFSVSLSFANADNDADNVNTIFYCDSTATPNCDPYSGNSAVGTSSFSMSHSIPPGHTVSAVIRVSDPGGVYADSVLGITVDSPKTFVIPDPVDIYRSVGPGQTTPLEQGPLSSNQLTVIADQATFSSPLGINVGVGDALFYDSDSDGVIDALAFIHERNDSQTFTIKTVSGSDPLSSSSHVTWKLYRAYTSLFNAESGNENSGIVSDASIAGALKDFDDWTNGKDISAQTGSDENWHFALYAGTTADASDVHFNGWTKDREQIIHLFTPKESNHVGVSQRHEGTWNSSKYRLSVNSARGLRSSLSRTHIEGLQIEITGSGDNLSAIQLEKTENIVHSNIIRSSVTGNNLRGINFTGISSDGGSFKESWNLAYNNIIYGFLGTSSTGAFVGNGDQSGRGIRFINNTFYNNTYGIFIYTASTYRAVTAVNNLIFSTSRSFNTDTNTSGTWRVWNNITSGTAVNTTSNISNNLTNVNPNDILQNPAAGDFSLKAGSSAIDYGVSVTPYFNIDDNQSHYEFFDDILGSSRSGNFDVGAFEY